MFDSSLSLSLVYSPVCVQHKIMTTTMRSGFVLDWLGNEFFVITIYSNLGRPWLEQSMCFIPFSITSCLAWRRAIALNQCCSRWRLDVLNFSLRSAMLLSSFTSCISLHSLSVRLNLVRLWISFCSAISFSTCDFARFCCYFQKDCNQTFQLAFVLAWTDFSSWRLRISNLLDKQYVWAHEIEYFQKLSWNTVYVSYVHYLYIFFGLNRNYA